MIACVSLNGLILIPAAIIFGLMFWVCRLYERISDLRVAFEEAAEDGAYYAEHVHLMRAGFLPSWGWPSEPEAVRARLVANSNDRRYPELSMIPKEERS